VLDDEQLRLRLGTEALRRAELEDADHTVTAYNGIYRRLAGAAAC
jgi:hypothetical protein